MSWFRGRRRGAAAVNVDVAVVDGLRHPNPLVRAASARSCGRARMEAAVPLLRERLLDPQPGVRGAAAAALGRIGGGRAADALLYALRTRRLSAGQLARELARGAPDLYLEAALAQPDNRQIRPALALAAGLRGRSPLVARILVELLEGDDAERAAACHGLASLGRTEAVPLLIDRLFDKSPRVRQAARGALNRLGARVPTGSPR